MDTRRGEEGSAQDRSSAYADDVAHVPPLLHGPDQVTQPCRFLDAKY